MHTPYTVYRAQTSPGEYSLSILTIDPQKLLTRMSNNWNLSNNFPDLLQLNQNLKNTQTNELS